jgi:hypothetical protein
LDLPNEDPRVGSFSLLPDVDGDALLHDDRGGVTVFNHDAVTLTFRTDLIGKGPGHIFSSAGIAARS